MHYLYLELTLRLNAFFSTVNQVWTSEKSKLSVETLKAILCVKYNSTNSCEDFYNILKNDNNLHKQIHSNKKYVKELNIIHFFIFINCIYVKNKKILRYYFYSV